MAVTRPYRPNSLVPDIVPAKDSPLEQQNAQCEVGLRFYNGMRHPVTVIFRSGIEITIPPIIGARHNCFYVRNVHHLTPSVIVDTRRLLDDSLKYVNGVAESFHRAFERTAPQKNYGQFPNQRYIDFELTKKTFDENAGVIYLENLDILVSTLNPAYVPRHPFTVGAFADGLLEVDPSISELNSFHYRVTIVDSSRKFGGRWINIHGTVYYVPAISNSELTDGVYVIRSTPTQGTLDIQLPGARCYDFEVAEKELGLWTSYSEALTLGDPQSEMKRRFDAATHEANMAQLEAKRTVQEMTAANERERRDQEIEIARLKHDLQIREGALTTREQEMRVVDNELRHRLEILKREQEYRERMYDTRMLSRKEGIEWLKLTPIIIGGLGAIFAAFKTLKAK